MTPQKKGTGTKTTKPKRGSTKTTTTKKKTQQPSQNGRHRQPSQNGRKKQEPPATKKRGRGKAYSIRKHKPTAQEQQDDYIRAVREKIKEETRERLQREYTVTLTNTEMFIITEHLERLKGVKTKTEQEMLKKLKSAPGKRPRRPRAKPEETAKKARSVKKNVTRPKTTSRAKGGTKRRSR